MRRAVARAGILPHMSCRRSRRAQPLHGVHRMPAVSSRGIRGSSSSRESPPRRIVARGARAHRLGGVDDVRASMRARKISSGSPAQGGSSRSGVRGLASDPGRSPGETTPLRAGRALFASPARRGSSSPPADSGPRQREPRPATQAFEPGPDALRVSRKWPAAVFALARDVAEGSAPAREPASLTGPAAPPLPRVITSGATCVRRQGVARRFARRRCWRRWCRRRVSRTRSSRRESFGGALLPAAYCRWKASARLEAIPQALRRHRGAPLYSRRKASRRAARFS